LGLNAHSTSYEKSPDSLATYSSLPFANWIVGLIKVGVGLEKVIHLELEQKLELYAVGEKRTLLDL